MPTNKANRWVARGTVETEIAGNSEAGFNSAGDAGWRAVSEVSRLAPSDELADEFAGAAADEQPINANPIARKRTVANVFKMVRMTHAISFGAPALAVIIACFGCSENRGPVPVSENSASPADSAGVNNVRVAPDLSPTGAEFAVAGFPAIDVAWSPADYIAAADVLVAIAANDARRLPRKFGENSASVFARIIAVENLAPLADTTLGLPARIETAMAYMAPIEQITLVYTHAGTPRLGTFDAEAAALHALNVRLAATMAELATAYIRQRAPTDADFPSRAAGYVRLMAALQPNISAAIAGLADATGFRVECREALADELAQTMPRVMPHLPPTIRAEFHDRIMRLANMVEPDSLRRAFARLADAIDATASEAVAGNPAAVTMHREHAGHANADGWAEIESTAGKFSVRMLGPADDYTTTARTTAGGEITMHTVTSVGTSGRMFSVTRYVGAARDADGTPLPERVANSFALSDSLIGQSRFTSPTTGDGIEIVSRDGQTIARVRVFVVGNDAFQLVAEFPADADPEASAIATTFFESFRQWP